MNPTLIQGSAGVLPTEIVYIPEGTHQITPTVNGKAQQITVHLPREKGEKIAASFQRALERRHGDTVRPILDFDHKASGPAAAIPKAFRYQAGTGMMLEVEWTGAGASAIQGRDFSYFSPEFHVDDNGVPLTIPSRGSIGSLVNHPAFRSIPRIAAADHGGQESAEEEIDRRANSLIAAGDVGSADEAVAKVIAADPGLYERYCDSLEAQAAQEMSQSTSQQAGLEERAKALVAAGEASTVDEAASLIFEREPTAYSSYLASLSR